MESIEHQTISPKKCRACRACVTRGRTGALVALSKLLRLPTHPDAARSSDGITALLSASCGDQMHDLQMFLSIESWHVLNCVERPLETMEFLGGIVCADIGT